MSRPGARLLGHSLVAGERRGKPGPAREAALEAAASAAPEAAAAHLLDAVYASLQAGEPRRACALLDALDPVTDDAAIGRRWRACRAWANALDYNWYPGDIGGELTADVLADISLPVGDGPADAETRLIEACVNYGPGQLPGLRSLITSLGLAGRKTAQQQMAGSAVGTLDSLRSTALEAESVTLAAWALLAQADLARRAGFAEAADAQLSDVRELCEQLGDAVGLANTYLMEGDWFASPASSPEALGFQLDSESQSGGEICRARASAAYAQAGKLLAGQDAPLASGALALRQAALAWWANDFDRQQRSLAEAAESFEAAGDGANGRLVVVHRLLGEIARGEVAQVILLAGTRWDLAPRGPIEEILAWAGEHGSRSFCSGLGRLCQRAGERWERAGDYDRAEACCSLALPLVWSSRGVPAAAVLTVLARLDGQRDLSVRALVRLEQALAGFETPTEIGDRPEQWMRAVDVVMGIVLAQIQRAGSSGFGGGIAGLERAADKLDELVHIPGVPTGAVTENLQRDQAEILERLRNMHRDATLEEVAEASKSALPPGGERMLAVAAQGAREQVAQARCLVAMYRARQLRQQGWEVESERWYAEAMNRIRAAGKAQSYLRVLASAQRGLDEEASRLFAELEASGRYPDHMLAPLALRARETARARALFQRLDLTKAASEQTWRDVADRAEAALETGDPQVALTLAARAIDMFESRVASLTRDPDRVAACDDISAAFLYLVATRACLAIAQAHESGGDDGASREALERAFAFADRGRSLALSSLLGRGAHASREWQQAATEWAVAFERLLNAYETLGGAGASGLLTRLSCADEKLVAIEAELEASGQRAPQPARAPLDAAALRSGLPEGTLLVEYQLAGPQLVVIALTRDRTARCYTRLERGVLEPNVNALLRACAGGTAGCEAGKLSKLLLNPIARLLRACRRVIVVPFGALHSVPFHALPFDGEPLGETHILSYLPAASLLRSCAVDRPLQGTGAVVVGDPEFTGRDDLRRLPGAALEAEVVARLRGTRDVLVGEQATEARLRPLLTGRDIVHLAAHAHLDDIAPSTSSVVLAGRDELTVSDLVGMRIDAGLAVLSACDTGRGVATLGGDLVGLARGLLAAGIERSIVSLWPVDDVVACVTMAAFYESLSDDTPPAHALAAAQRAVRRMSGEDVVRRYRDLGGELNGEATTRRRGGGAMSDLLRPRGVPLHPAFEDDYEPPDESPVENLSGALERVWAPFVLVGV